MLTVILCNHPGGVPLIVHYIYSADSRIINRSAISFFILNNLSLKVWWRNKFIRVRVALKSKDVKNGQTNL